MCGVWYYQWSVSAYQDQLKYYRNTVLINRTNNWHFKISAMF